MKRTEKIGQRRASRPLRWVSQCFIHSYILREKTKSNNNFVFYLFMRRKRSKRGYRFIHYRIRLKIDLTNNLNRISSIIRVFRNGFVRREFPFNVLQLNNIFVSTNDGKWHNPRTMGRNNGQDGSLKGNGAGLAKVGCSQKISIIKLNYELWMLGRLGYVHKYFSTKLVYFQI